MINCLDAVVARNKRTTCKAVQMFTNKIELCLFLFYLQLLTAEFCDSFSSSDSITNRHSIIKYSENSLEICVGSIAAPCN